MLWACLSACGPQFQQGPARDDSPLFCEHVGASSLAACWLGRCGIARIASQPLIAGGAAVRPGVSARRARRLHGHAAAQTLDRHGAPAGRPDHAWQSCGGCRSRPSGATCRPAKWACASFALLGLAALAGCKLSLGGWTSSNYAAVACPDLPTCQQSWWPPMDFRDAFVLWRGLDIDYTGGVLANPARIAIHVTHRIGALVAGLSLDAASGALTIARARSRALEGDRRPV